MIEGAEGRAFDSRVLQTAIAITGFGSPAALELSRYRDLEPTRTLGYVTPNTATFAQQQVALDAALALAKATGRALRLPLAYNKKHQPKPLCAVLNPQALPHDAMLVSPEEEKRQTCSKQPLLPLPRAYGLSAATQGPGTLCVSFQALLAQASAIEAHL